MQFQGHHEKMVSLLYKMRDPKISQICYFPEERQEANSSPTVPETRHGDLAKKPISIFHLGVMTEHQRVMSSERKTVLRFQKYIVDHFRGKRTPAIEALR